MTLLPFDIEKAKAGAKVVNKLHQDRPIKLISFDEKGVISNINYSIKDKDDLTYTIDGKHCMEKSCVLNLFILEEQKKQYTLPLSRRDANEITRDMWSWLAENPDRHKYDWMKLNPNVPELMFSCACCQYVIDETKSDSIFHTDDVCGHCPLYSLWGINCEAYGSPFRLWSDGIDRANNARKIANAAIEELRKMNEDKGAEILEKIIQVETKVDPYAELKKAHAEGKTIQFNSLTYGWLNTEIPSWDYLPFQYRIKPEPKIRPWKPEEVPVGALLRDSKGLSSMILTVDNLSFYFIRPSGLNSLMSYPRETIVESFYFSDALTYIYKLEHSLNNGKTWLPCGILE